MKAQVIGSGAFGHLRVRLGARDLDVPLAVLPPRLRTPNAEFVAVVSRGNVIGAEPHGSAWLETQDRVREVFNSEWDPIGVAADVADEYDIYIAEVFELLRDRRPESDIARHLKRIETESMGLSDTGDERRIRTARCLLALDLPTMR